jgi:signal transduction histidine kinase
MSKVSRLSRFNIASLALGLAFLYLPILILVIYSFNASRLVTVWGGWSLRWYHEFFNDRAMIEASWMSLRVAVSSASIATLIGTLAAVALSRGERFRGRTLFSGMLYAPLVMPEVITGLSLLLLFVALNAERGFWTVMIAHTTLTMCFVAVVVQSRLGSLDRSLEEAAMDLGCAPVGDAAADRACDRRRMDARLHALARRSRDRELHHGAGIGNPADPNLLRGAARRKTGDKRDLLAGDCPDRGRHRHRLARFKAVELAGRERSAVVNRGRS